MKIRYKLHPRGEQAPHVLYMHQSIEAAGRETLINEKVTGADDMAPKVDSIYTCNNG